MRKGKALTWVVFLVSGLPMTAANLMAAEYPERAIEILVPFGAGGDSDLSGRLLAQHELLDLAGRGLRDLLEADLARHLEVGQAALGGALGLERVIQRQGGLALEVVGHQLVGRALLGRALVAQGGVAVVAGGHQAGHDQAQRQGLEPE